MASYQLVLFFFVVALFIGGIQAQFGSSRSVNERCPESCCQSPCASDLGTLLLLARAFDNPPPQPAKNDINADEIINKLINALVYTTTQSVGSGGGPNRGYGSGNSGQGGNGGLLDLSVLGGNGGHAGHGNNGDGLLGLNLLGAGPNNVLGLDVGGQGLLGVGIGGDSGSRGGGSGNGSGQGLLGLGGGNGGSGSSSGSSGGTGTLGAVTGLVNGIL